MCRMCIVEIDTGRGPALQPACMIPVRARHEGRHRDARSPRRRRTASSSSCSSTTRSTARCATRAASARCRTRRCRYGPGESRFVEEKRHFEKPIPISDLVALDRERCILCDRCTRFANEVAGDPLIHFQDRGNQTAGQHVPRPPLRQLLQRQHRADLPGRRAHRHALPLQGPPVGPRPGREHLHHLLGRLPHARAVEPQRGPALPGRRRRPGQLGLAVRQGPLRLRGGQQRRPPRRSRSSARATRSRAVPWGEALVGRGRRRAARRRRPDADRACSAAPGSPTRAPTPGPSWPRACIGTDHVDAQLGDGLPAEVGARPARAPRSTTPARPAAPCCCSAPTSRRSCRSSSCACATPSSDDGVTVVELAPAAHSVSDARRRHAAATGPAPPARWCGRCWPARRRQEVGGVDARGHRGRRRRCSPTGPVTVVLGRANLAESADGVVAAAAGDPRRPPRGAVPQRPAARQRARRPRHGPGARAAARAASRSTRPRLVRARGWPTVPGRARASTPPASCRPPPTARSTCWCCSAPTRWPTSPTATWPRAASPAPARSSPSTGSSPRRSSRPTWCCAAAGSAEVDGTTTNLEGRVSTVARKVTPPGTARDDWMIAAELAACSAPTSGSSRPTRSSRRSTASRRATPASPPTSSRRSAAATASLVGAAPADAEAAVHAVARRRPDAGEAAVAAAGADADEERQAAEAEATEAQADAERRRRPPRPSAAAPALLAFTAPRRRPSSPAVDAYSLRLVATRKLYDLGTARAALAVARPGSPADTVAAPAPARLRPPRRRPPATVVHGHLVRRARSRCRVVPDAARRRGAAAVVPSTSPAAAGRRAHRRHRARSPRCGWRRP